MSKLLQRVYYFFYLLPFRFYIRVDKKHSYHGPIKGNDIDIDMYQKLSAYRDNFYQNDMSYLIPKNDDELREENLKNSRSFHIWAQDRDGNVVGACMFTPFPFSVNSMLTVSDKVKYKEYLEVSRLLVLKKRMGIGKRLLFKAGPYFAPQGRYKFRGIVGICLNKRLGMFTRLGMKKIGQISLTQRNQNSYHVIAASICDLKKQMNTLALKSLFSWTQNLMPQRLNKLVLCILLVAITGIASAEQINVHNASLINRHHKKVDSPAVSRDGEYVCWIGSKRDGFLSNERNRVFMQNLNTNKVVQVRKSSPLNADTRCHFTPDNRLLIDEIRWRPLALFKTWRYVRRTKDVEPMGFASQLTFLDLDAAKKGKRRVVKKLKRKHLRLKHKKAYIKHSQVSPNGKWLIYYISHEYPKDQGIHLMNLQTRKMYKLTSVYDKHPTWSGDGSKVLFHYQFKKDGKEQAQIGYFDLEINGNELMSFKRELMDSITGDYIYHKHPMLGKKSDILFFHASKKDGGNKKLFARKFVKDSQVFEINIFDQDGEKLKKAKHPTTDYSGGMVFLGKFKKQKHWALYKINSIELKNLL